MLNDSWDKRIIPTRMGTSYQRQCCGMPYKDHPHAYGDKSAVRAGYLQLPGSSPRVWGQVFSPSQKYLYPRIIPTRMGTRRTATQKTGCQEDHPHAYGDKVNCLIDYRKPQGSSPRVWGQAMEMLFQLLPTRIIPTRMGTRIDDLYTESED